MPGNKIAFTILLVMICGSTVVSRVARFPGDEAFTRMDYVTADRQYDSVMHAAAPHAELLWRLSRLHVAMGDIAESGERAQHYKQAEEYARMSVSLDSTCSDGYAWLAAALGCEAMDAGSRRKVALAHEIKGYLDRAVALDPRNDVAWSILGTFYRSLGGVSWFERQLAALLLGSLPEGGYAESDSAFQRAIRIAPDAVRHRFELAMLYEETGRLAEAAAEYEQCVNLPPQMVSDRRRKEEAARWLEEHREYGHVTH